MKAVHVQLQPALSPELDVADAIARLRQAGERAGATPEVTEGDDSGRYVNLDFHAIDPVDLWSAIRAELLAVPNLARVTIVCCQGMQGWDDYLLLHHFDPTEPLDAMP